MVKSIEHGGAAERAGLVVGDTIQKIDGLEFRTDTGIAMAMIERHTSSSPAVLIIERANQRLTISLVPTTP